MGVVTIETLYKMVDEIEQETEKCRQNLKFAGTLNIKIQSLSNILLRQADDSEDYKKLQTKAKKLQKEATRLSGLEKQKREKCEQEMTDSKIKYKKITEACDNTSELLNPDFIETQSSRLDDFIMNSMDSLDSLKRQSIYIDRISNTLRASFIRMSGGSDLLYKIESRVAGDKSLFLILIAFLVVFIILLRFIF